MPKKKLARFAELETFPNSAFISFEDSKKDGFRFKEKWNELVFNNKQNIVLELGCGKGEYTVGLARCHPGKNFIGIDIKGNRMWKGAKEALTTNLKNSFFLRMRIDYIQVAFGPEEVSEIWITFPDPQPEKPRKRLTSPVFLEKYKLFLRRDGIIHLKTDSKELYDYTLSVIRDHKLKLLDHTPDLYSDSIRRPDVEAIKTFYESKFRKEGKKITYLAFCLTPNPV
jgi:tRNA (guanine-N7-)-methyltransferase